MEEVFQRFPHLYENIFKSLDNESLANCEVVSKIWYSYLPNIIEKRRAENIQETFRRFYQLHVEFRQGFDTTRVQNIFNAARMGDFETAQKSIMEGILNVHNNLLNPFIAINSDFIEDFLTVHWAANNGYFDIVKYLVDITEDKNPRDKNGNRPLHYAAKKGHFNTMKYLVDKEVKSNNAGLYKINDRNPRNKVGYTPLHEAALRGHLDIVMYLVDRIDNKIDKNPRNNFGTTPLHEAAKMGHIDVVKYIVANIDEKDKNLADRGGTTPQKLALINRFFDIAELFNPL
jgi:hypothetical protein